MWSALTCQRFSKRRLVAADKAITVAYMVRDKSRTTKAATSRRTPHKKAVEVPRFASTAT
jgi:hypothetical protein